MPHCILDCSQTIENHAPLERIIQSVHDAALESGLFGERDVKVRAKLFEHLTVGGTQDDFVHIVAYILSGRTEAQRADLSARVITALKTLLPDVPILSIDVREINRATYNNRNTV